MLVPLVLLVDDDRGVARSVRRVLELDGYRVAAVGSCSAARMLEGPFAVAIIDQNLPDGDGVSLARDLLRSGQVLQVVFFIGDHELPAGADAVAPMVEKPYLNRLLRRLEEAIVPQSQRWGGRPGYVPGSASLFSPAETLTDRECVVLGDQNLVLARHDGRLTMGHCAAARREVARLLGKHTFRRVLVDMQEAVLDYSLLDLHQFCATFSSAFPRHTSLAFVTSDQTAPGPHLRFIESVSRHHGMSVTAFGDRDEATDWLRRLPAPSGC